MITPADADPCAGCGAEPFEPCREGCTGYAGMLDDMARQGEAIIARALTVQASKLYALLHYRAELAEYHAQEQP